MKLKIQFALPALLGGFLAGAASANAHEHLAAGANSTSPGSPLIFVNAGDFDSDASGFVFGLDAGEPGSPYNGYYFTGDLAFVALAATPAFGGPEAQAAALGSHIEIVLETVEGPAGANLGFWETQQNGVDSTNLTWTVPVGLTNGTNHIVVSETDGLPGADPYGHIHGRIYSVDKPGLYRVGFRFVDVSTNGPGGGPIQAPSDRLHLYFQADVTIAGIATATNGISLSFAALSNVSDEDPTAAPTRDQSSPPAFPSPFGPLATPWEGRGGEHREGRPTFSRGEGSPFFYTTN